jgi:hypothetical protein
METLLSASTTKQSGIAGTVAPRNFSPSQAGTSFRRHKHIQISQLSARENYPNWHGVCTLISVGSTRARGGSDNAKVLGYCDIVDDAERLGLFRAANGYPDRKQPCEAAPDDRYGTEVQLQIAEGQLSRIDSENDFIWVKMSDGKEMQFSYTLMTDVEGADDDVEGLVDDVEALAKGTQVRVHYKPGIDKDVLSDDEINTAAKIEVDRAL